MYSIKLNDNGSLEVRSRDPLYRWDNLYQKIIFYIPHQIDGINTLTSDVYLTYFPTGYEMDDGGYMVRLERLEQKHKDICYKYTLPANCEMTKYPGEITSYLVIVPDATQNKAAINSNMYVFRVIDCADAGERFSRFNEIKRKVENAQQRASLQQAISGL